MSRQYANRLISAAPVARNLESTLSISEIAARQLSKVEPSKRQEIFDKATEGAVKVLTAR